MLMLCTRSPGPKTCPHHPSLALKCLGRRKMLAPLSRVVPVHGLNERQPAAQPVGRLGVLCGQLGVESSRCSGPKALTRIGPQDITIRSHRGKVGARFGELLWQRQLCGQCLVLHGHHGAQHRSSRARRTVLLRPIPLRLELSPVLIERHGRRQIRPGGNCRTRLLNPAGPPSRGSTHSLRHRARARAARHLRCRLPSHRLNHRAQPSKWQRLHIHLQNRSSAPCPEGGPPTESAQTSDRRCPEGNS
mmetsp:Transcript_35742/g.76194  ORF Transcript_35742/g.76194 Transcript_35742/m.76194 type:complete len:247 (+) Transcript_35742:416-1156(+)